MPTVPDEKNAGIADGVVINNSWAPKAILGEGGKVTGIELMRCVSVRDANGRFAPVYDESETITVPCSNVLVAIGQRSDYGAVLAGTAAETPDGQLIAHDGVTFQTAEADVFVGGDCATGPKYTIDAIASGREGRGVHPPLRQRRPDAHAPPQPARLQGAGQGERHPCPRRRSRSPRAQRSSSTRRRSRPCATTA